MRRLLFGALAIVVALVLAGALFLFWFLSGDGVRRALEEQASRRLGEPVVIGRASAQVLPRPGIELSDVRIGSPARVTLSVVEVSTDLGALLRRRIRDADITIADSRLETPVPLGVPGVEPAGDGEEPADTSFRVESIRSIALRNVTIVSRGREMTLSATSSLDGDVLRLTGLTVATPGTNVEAEGVVQLSPEVDAQLRIDASRLDLDELVALTEAFGASGAARSPASSGAPGATRVRARIGADTATAGGIPLQQLATDLEMTGSRIVLSPLNFLVFGGRYTGTVEVGLTPNISGRVKWRVSDVDVGQLSAFAGSAGRVTGRLAGAGAFSGTGDAVEGLLRSAKGEGTVEIVDGEIRGLNLVRTVVDFFGRSDQPGPPASDAFTRIDARFTVSNGVFRADAFALRSPDADIVGTLSMTLEGGQLDGRFDMSLSEALSARAGTDLYRYTREGNRIVLPARVDGTMASPRLSIDAAAAVKRGLRNEVEERLKGILDGLTPAPGN